MVLMLVSENVALIENWADVTLQRTGTADCRTFTGSVLTVGAIVTPESFTWPLVGPDRLV